MFIKQALLWIFKGLALGGALLIPGLSASTLAIVMGIYEKTVVSLTQCIPWKKTKKSKNKNHFYFLLCLATGVVLALLLLAKPLSFLLFHFSLPLQAFFIGLIGASVPSLFKMTGQSPSSFLWVVFWTGLFLGGFYIIFPFLSEQSALSALFIPEKSHFLSACLNGFEQNPLCSEHTAQTLLFLSGFVAVFASVWPGLSGSFVLLLIGTYHYVLQNLADRDLWNLAVFALGGLLGLLLALFVVRLLLKKYKKLFFCMALGIIIAGIPSFIPSALTSGPISQWGIFFLSAGGGAFLFYILNRLG